MYITIYFNDKPLVLSNLLSEDLQSVKSTKNTVFMQGYSPAAVNSMIDRMQSPDTQAGIFVHDDLELLRNSFWNHFLVIQAGGGLVKNEKQEILFMFRRGKWDLPKGKLDAGETMEACALREVREETGLDQVQLEGFLLTTYHTYHENGSHILKESHWYKMFSNSSNKLVPQTEEDILELKWVKSTDLSQVLSNTYPSVNEVLQGNV